MTEATSVYPSSCMVWAANADRVPPAQYTTTWLDLSGIRPSTVVSRVPLGMWTASGSAPCSYSSGSRTSSTTVGLAAISSSACAGSTSRTSALAAASISLKVGTAITVLSVAPQPVLTGPAPDSSPG